MSVSRFIPILESVKDALGVSQDGPGTQSKPAQVNKGSTSAAMGKLKQLRDKQTAGRSEHNKIRAYGSKKTKK